MDWASLYPTYAVGDKEQTKSRSHDNDEEEKSTASKALTKNVEVADIGCGFGGLLFALAPKFPDTLILGALLHYTCTMAPEAVLTETQAWKSELLSQSMCKRKCVLCVCRMLQLAPTRTRPAFAPTR